MELTQLEMFVAVAEHGSVTRAARALGRAPSNLSTRIRQLEREVGAPLLLRERREASISADGEVFLDYARRILELVEEAKSVHAGREPHGLLRLGALDSTAMVRMPALIAQFHKRYPAVQLELRSGPSGLLFEQVLNGSLTAAFSDGRPASTLLTGFPVFREELVAIYPRGSRLGSDVEQTVFMFGPTCSYRQRFEDWLGSRGVQPTRAIDLSSYPGMVACVAEGSGIAMLPASLLAALPGCEEVDIHPIEGPIGRAETWLMWRRDSRSDALQALCRMLRENETRAVQLSTSAGTETSPAG